jgi:hypothetical protein
MDVILVAIGGYFKLHYHRQLMLIGGTILLMDISGYWWLLMVINSYWWLFY